MNHVFSAIDSPGTVLKFGSMTITRAYVAPPALPDPPPPAPIAAGWPGLHDLARRPVTDPYATLAAVYGWAARLPENRAEQAAARLSSQPVNPAAVEAWANAFHNKINRRNGKPVVSMEAARLAAPIYVHNSATGLGDAVSGLYAVCGLADATGRPVVYRSHSAKWLAPVSHPGVKIEPIERGSLGIDLNGGEAGYARSIASAPTRTQGYCDNVAAALGIPPFKPARPAHVRLDGTV